MRWFAGYLGHLITYESFQEGGYSGWGLNGSYSSNLGIAYLPTHSQHPVAIPMLGGTDWLSPSGSGFKFSSQNAMGGGEPYKRYRYSLSGHGGENASYSLVESVEYPQFTAYCRVGAYALESKKMLPTDNEIRPINIAVKYHIRAK